MIFDKKTILLCLFVALTLCTVDARRLKKHRRHKSRQSSKHFEPMYRQMNPAANTDVISGYDDLDGSGGGTGADTGPGSGTDANTDNDRDMDNISQASAEALVFIQPTQAASEPRILKGLLFQALLDARRDRDSGGGQSIPYIIVNVPNNITNINQNSLNNTALAPTELTSPTTANIPTALTSPITVTSAPTTTRRRVYKYNPVPLQPQRTKVEYHRGSSPAAAPNHPHNFAPTPSNQLVPVFLPPEIQQLMSNGNAVRRRRRGGQHKRVQKKTNTKRQSFNPFAAFANGLRRIQYL